MYNWLGDLMHYAICNIHPFSPYPDPGTTKTHCIMRISTVHDKLRNISYTAAMIMKGLFLESNSLLTDLCRMFGKHLKSIRSHMSLSFPPSTLLLRPGNNSMCYYVVSRCSSFTYPCNIYSFFLWYQWLIWEWPWSDVNDFPVGRNGRSPAVTVVTRQDRQQPLLTADTTWEGPRHSTTATTDEGLELSRKILPALALYLRIGYSSGSPLS